MIIKYAIVGVLNTLITFIAIFFLFKIFKMNYNIAFFLGYIFGLANSFFMNKYFTFESKQKWKDEIKPFIVVFIFTYILSHICLWIFIELLYLNKDISILTSMLIYTLVGYIYNKKVFNYKV